MELQQNTIQNQDLPTKEAWHAPLDKVTLVSKILAAIVFITLPFVGFLLGMHYGNQEEVTASIPTADHQQEITTTATSSVEEVPVTVTTTEPKPNTYTKESFLSENLAVEDSAALTRCKDGGESKCRIDSFLQLAPKCFDYFGGSDCTVSISGENFYNLKPGTLKADTGPLVIKKHMTLMEVRALESGRVFLAWGFGDAGAVSQSFSIWDTNKGTHTFVSGWGGMYEERLSLSVAIEQGSKHFSILDNTSDENTEGKIDVFDENMFMPLYSNRQGTDPVRYCISVKPTPKDRTNPGAPWLLEYSHTCGATASEKVHRSYELDPVSGKLTPFVEM